MLLNTIKELNIMLTNWLSRFSVNVSFLYLLYQFLVDRFKDEDYDGPLTRAILEVIRNKNHIVTLLANIGTRYLLCAPPSAKKTLRRHGWVKFIRVLLRRAVQRHRRL